MVDFRKKLGNKPITKNICPEDIYNGLDRASDKGPLRPVQKQLLQKWESNYLDQKDVILKLHTGQGKTLIGLLILQSRLNRNLGPAVYLCPDKYLVNQTCEQADNFGIPYVVFNDDIPDEFIDSKKLLITTVSRLFNGKTQFGLGNKSIPISSIIIDDAHACIDYIKKSYTITLSRDSISYQQILPLFGHALSRQGAGSYSDIKNGEFEAILAVPYWEWNDKFTDIAEILSKNKDSKEIKYAWPILKDNLKNCRCVISGNSIEITPYIPPIEMFESFSKASHRVFMSATVNNDSFFIKELGVNPKVINNALKIENEKWSGEKMILIPSLIDESLNRQEVVNLFANKDVSRTYGVVAIVPSFASSRDWEKYGSVIANNSTIYDEIDNMKNKNYNQTLVIANRYDGIDLPDNVCRVLVIDSKPYTNTLEDRYLDICRSTSKIISIKLAQKIEQGFGRGVRGEKDYCAIIITGNDIVRTLRSKETKKNFSLQTRTQVDLGLEIAEFAREEIKEGTEPIVAFNGLIKQMLDRDEGWKEFYTSKMDDIEDNSCEEDIINILDLERQAEEAHLHNDSQIAISKIQEIIDSYIDDDNEKGWYLQEIARYKNSVNAVESDKMQAIAHKNNPYLFKPKNGMIINKMTKISFKRIENILNKVRNFENHEDLSIEIMDITDKLRFGLDSTKFEKALCDLGEYLGFVSQQPDTEWGEGPDNLWKLDDTSYLLIECKNKIKIGRSEIYKDESGQLNNACSWFKRNYGDLPVKNILIAPTRKLSTAAGFNDKVSIMLPNNLEKLVDNTLSFYKGFKEFDMKSLSESKIQCLLQAHNLLVEDIRDDYSKEPKYF